MNDPVVKKPRAKRVSKPAEPKIKIIKEKVIKEAKPRISKVKSISNITDDYYNNSDLDDEITSDSDAILYMIRSKLIIKKPIETSDMSTQYSSDEECSTISTPI